MSYFPQNLPLVDEEQLENRQILKKVASAHRFLAELKGMSASIPNEAILINTLSLQEAKDSSEIENIVTTHDELYKQGISSDYLNPVAKEVQNYSTALKHGFEKIRESKLIRLQDILAIQSLLEGNNAGLRKLPGTELKNIQTGEVIYTPPQDANDVSRLMHNLIQYINSDELSDCDPLVKMAIIHFQLESIHPFYDGNGRTGRILNILYLVAQGLLDLPVLYLSGHIIKNKAAYYSSLQGVRDNGDWHAWLLLMLESVEVTAKKTIELIVQIKSLMHIQKNRIRNELPKIYSQDLLNNIFSHPYTKIDFIIEDLGVTRITAAKYLGQLVDIGLLKKHKVGRSNYFVNIALYELLLSGSK